MNYLLIPILVPPMIEDIKTREIRNIYWVMIVLVKGLILAVTRDRDALISGLLGAGVISLMFLLSYLVSRDGIGLGDMKLMLSAAFFMGLESFLKALLLMSVLSLVYSLILLALGKVKKETPVPFVPFIFAGITMTVISEVFS